MSGLRGVWDGFRCETVWLLDLVRHAGLTGLWVLQVGFGGFMDVLTVGSRAFLLTFKRGKHETGLRLRDNMSEDVIRQQKYTHIDLSWSVVV